MRRDEDEPKKWASAAQASLLLLGFFITVFASAGLNWEGAPQRQFIEASVTWIPESPPLEVEPEPEPVAKEEPPEESERLAEIALKKKEEEDKRKKDAEDKRKKDAEDKRKKDAEDKRKKDAEDKRKKDAEDKRKKDAEDKRKKDAEDKRKKDAEDKRKKDAEDKRKKDAEDKRKKDAEAAQSKLWTLQLGRVTRKITNELKAFVDNLHIKNPKGVRVGVVVLHVEVDENGNLKGTPVVKKSSGDKEYDKQAVREVVRVTRLRPFPMPDKRDAFIYNDPELLKEFTNHEISIYPNN